MSRIKKSQLTRLEIIQVAARRFLKNGYSNTTAKSICDELEMSTGNLTFYYSTKEHLLAELVNMLCHFQWKLMDDEAAEGYSSVMAVCLELVAMAVMCEESEIARDFYHSAYTSPLTLEIMRRNDAERSKQVFGAYRPDWTGEQFAAAEMLVSGIEYGILTGTPDLPPLEKRVEAALNSILWIYGVPKDIRKTKIQKLLAMDYRSLGRRVLDEFRDYVEKTNEQAFYDLLEKRADKKREV